MISFYFGETVIIELEVRNPKTNELFNPATFVRLSVYDDPNGACVDNADMTRDSTGLFHYDFNCAPGCNGEHIVIVTIKDGTRTTIETASFVIEKTRCD